MLSTFPFGEMSLVASLLRAEKMAGLRRTRYAIGSKFLGWFEPKAQVVEQSFGSGQLGLFRGSTKAICFSARCADAVLTCTYFVARCADAFRLASYPGSARESSKTD